MLRSFSIQALSAGLLSAFVGFASSFAVVIEGLRAVGASPAEAASGLFALSVAMGACAVYLALKSKMPVSIAWSTPGAALLVSAGVVEGGFAAAVGAFLVSGVLLTIAGLWKPLGRWVGAIPPAIASAMLAGVLLNFCIAPIRAIAIDPVGGLIILLSWAVVWRFARLYAVPVVVVVAAALIMGTTDMPALPPDLLLPDPVFVVPAFTLPAIVGIALPLFIVTMASQNIPGIAVLNANDYHPKPGPLFSLTGVFSIVAAPFGGHAVNLAAITAALCAGPDAHPDPARRYWAAVVAGVTYILFGLLAGLLTAFISASPSHIIQAVAGLALLGALANSITGAVTAAGHREPAVITFLVTVSGVSFFGIGSAFWGLVFGIAMHGLGALRRGNSG